jgi:glucose-1-phosphate cytidylyltransferase
MKVVILAGGLGTRLSEETEIKPKPMVEIGNHPILWHIMKHYGHYGFREFYIALGYRGEIIKRFFMDYYSLDGSISIDLVSGQVERQDPECEDWVVHLKNTGQEANTGGRIKRLQPWLNDGTFMLTYGDGVSDVNLQDLLSFHRAHGRIATVTAVRPPARFGGLIFDGDTMVVEFTEKPQVEAGWINGGYMVFEPEVFNYLESDETSLEADVLERLAADSQLAAFQHQRFWQCMDTLRDKRLLESLWQDGRAPWKLWE